MTPQSAEPKVTRVLGYLRSETDRPTYLKSRHIADEVGLSASEVGMAMCRLADREEGPQVERWASSGGITWRVSTGCSDAGG